MAEMGSISLRETLVARRLRKSSNPVGSRHVFETTAALPSVAEMGSISLRETLVAEREGFEPSIRD